MFSHPQSWLQNRPLLNRVILRPSACLFEFQALEVLITRSVEPISTRPRGVRPKSSFSINCAGQVKKPTILEHSQPPPLSSDFPAWGTASLISKACSSRPLRQFANPVSDGTSIAFQKYDSLEREQEPAATAQVVGSGSPPSAGGSQKVWQSGPIKGAAYIRRVIYAKSRCRSQNVSDQAKDSISRPSKRISDYFAYRHRHSVKPDDGRRCSEHQALDHSRQDPVQGRDGLCIRKVVYGTRRSSDDKVPSQESTGPRNGPKRISVMPSSSSSCSISERRSVSHFLEKKAQPEHQKLDGLRCRLGQARARRAANSQNRENERPRPWIFRPSKLLSESSPSKLSMHPKLPPTPSDALIAALPPEAQNLVSQFGSLKKDLSYFAVRRFEGLSRKQNTEESLCAWNKSLGLKPGHLKARERNSLPIILSRYLAARAISEGRASVQLHDAETTDYLRTKGYSASDVLTWSRILFSSDASEVVSKFMEEANAISLSRSPGLPLFLLMFILRGRMLKGGSLRLLLDYIWKHYTEHGLGSESTSTPRMIGQQTAMIMMVRLIRHARVAWPKGLEEIADLATKLIDRECNGIVNLDRRRTQGLSHLYNRLLSLFAKPTSLLPVVMAPIQQRSQFCIIRKMTAFNPHIPITREGFRALTKIQLAHKKTEDERNWAKSKALAWPPWKEDLLGIDADSEHPGRNSRAADILSRATEAGYAQLSWERNARILAGWDTDGSPTIQTRTLFRDAPILPTADVDAAGGHSLVEKSDTWTARILATRTVKEAWACFATFEISSNDRAIGPYNAMFAKLLHAETDVVGGKDATSSVLPGDGKEAWPEPISPHDFLYVPSNPPTVGEFFDKMEKKGLKPQKYLLADLLDNAENLEQGIRYLRAGRLKEGEKDVLLGNTDGDVSYIRSTSISIPGRVIAAFVRLLCRAQPGTNTRFALPKADSLQDADCGRAYTTDPFSYAQSLVSALRSPYRPIWYALFQGLNHRTASLRPQALQKSWDSLLGLLHDMDACGIDLDFGGFRDIGEILEQVLLIDGHLMQPQQRKPVQEIDAKMKSLWLCKSLFHAMTYGGSIGSTYEAVRGSSWLPLDRRSQIQGRTDIIDIPSPAILHRTIRILGMGEDTASILTLLRWMHTSAPDLASIADELANSRRMTRRALTAARYFLEKTWRHEELEDRDPLNVTASAKQWQPGQKELLIEARKVVDQHVDDWGGWPTREELEQYHSVNKSKARRLRSNGGLYQFLAGSSHHHHHHHDHYHHHHRLEKMEDA